MKTRLLFIVTLVLAAIAGWFFFYRQPQATNVVEALIPATSVGVITLQDTRDFLDKSAQYDWWDETLNIPLLSQLDRTVKVLDSLEMQSDLGSLPVHISLHITGKDQLEPLYLIPSSGFDWALSSLETIAKRAFGEDKVQLSERNYLGRTLHEMQIQGLSFSLIIEGDFLVLSANALLVEDVLRAIEQDAIMLPGVKYHVADLKKSASLFLDCGKLDALASVFVEGETSLEKQEGLYLRIGLEPTAAGFLLDGSSVFSGDFVSSAESGLNLKNFVPVNASVIKWFGLENSTGTEVEGLDLAAYRALHQGDLCLLELDINNQSADQVLLATLKDIDQGKRQLTSLAERLMVQNDTLFRESFMDTEILFINKEDLPRSLYGGRYEGFQQTYFSTYNDVLLFGTSIDALKAVLAEYDAENTWGRSIERRRFIDDLVQESSLTAIYNFEYLTESLNGDLKERWKEFFKNAPGLLSALDLFSMQLSNTGSGVLLSAAVSFNETVSRTPVQVATNTDQPTSSALGASVNAFADTTLSTRPYVVRNHNNNQREIIFQDAAKHLYLVTDQGLVQWKKPVNGLIRGKISQVDYYNNRKLQYLFLTDSAIHLVDRNGEDVMGFPRALDTELPLQGHRVIDYDNTKKYRYAGADRRGNVYLYNKEGDQLEGWNPKPMGSQLLDEPEHVRIRGRDCFLMVERKGIVHLTNRRGEYYPGFPYQVNKRLSGEPVIVKAADFSRSRIIVGSENGEVLSLDFNGKVAARTQLLRPSASSTFRLVRDKLNNGYAIARRDANVVVFFDRSGNQLFSAPAERGNDLDYSFYNFRNDSEVMVVLDRSTEKAFLYNAQGESLVSSAINATAPVGIMFYQSRGEYELFVNFANQMAIYKVAK